MSTVAQWNNVPGGFNVTIFVQSISVVDCTLLYGDEVVGGGSGGGGGSDGDFLVGTRTPECVLPAGPRMLSLQCTSNQAAELAASGTISKPPLEIPLA